METSGESLSSNKLSRESEDSEFDIWRAYIIAKQFQKEVKTFKSNHLHIIVLKWQIVKVQFSDEKTIKIWIQKQQNIYPSLGSSWHNEAPWKVYIYLVAILRILTSCITQPNKIGL